MKEVRLDPHYPNTIMWQARALATHSFEFGANEPVAALIDMVRYLTRVDEDEVFKIMHALDPSRAATKEEALATSSNQAE